MARIFHILLVFSALVGSPALAKSESNRFPALTADIVFHDVLSACSGRCGLHLYAGAFVEEPMANAFGLADFTPVWNWEMEDSGLVALALSRPIVSFGNYAEISGEVGLAQRFGISQAQEVWGALYVHWKWFPWNNYVQTKIGVSTGLSYATKLDDLEVRRAGNGEGSHLLHFLSPEISFALPEYSDTELVVRFHHRSGGKDVLMSGSAIFNNTDGGAQYIKLGIRKRF